jgi:CRISPR-associated protein Csd2
VCLKRKIRNFVELSKEGELSKDGKQAYNILIKMDKALNTKLKEAFEAENLKKNKKKDRDTEEKARDYMCRNYYDVRTFGAVMNIGDDSY